MLLGAHVLGAVVMLVCVATLAGVVLPQGQAIDSRQRFFVTLLLWTITPLIRVTAPASAVPPNDDAAVAVAGGECIGALLSCAVPEVGNRAHLLAPTISSVSDRVRMHTQVLATVPPVILVIRPRNAHVAVPARQRLPPFITRTAVVAPIRALRAVVQMFRNR